MTSDSDNKHNVSNVTLLGRAITNDIFDSCLEDHMRIVINNREAGALCTLRNDEILGGQEDDVISGTEKGETIYGGNGNDNISGDKGDDIIYGNDGYDILIGGIGSDNLSGGSGKDVFHYYQIDDSIFDSPDKIIDFETGRDTIDISALSQIKGNTIEIKQVNHFSNQKNEMIVHYNQSENLTSLMLDYNGDGKADFLIEIIGEINPIADIVT
ncbi:MAG: M10 family metallopeptidase C-terminal domain-containing protein [Arsenophonus sp.]|nr:M10 family metallopeptidase C-terminal domain-containing protein [Arsenophonus sp.]